MPFGPWVNLLLIACAIAGIGAFLYTLAARIAWEIGLHDLRVEAHRLRVDYAKRLAMLRGDTIEDTEINVDVLDENGQAMELGEAVQQMGAAPDEQAARKAA